MVQSKIKVLSIKELSKDIYRLSLDAPHISKEAKPGQFINILCGENQNYILRRPFSIYSRNDTSIEIVFKVVGRGTAWLKEVESGSILDIIGPLGKGFEIKEDFESALLVSGGTGIAALRLLAEELKNKGTKVYIALGARSISNLPFSDELEKIAHKLYLATEDGTLGKKGLVTDLLSGLFKKMNLQQVYACGPNAMLIKVAELSSRYKIPCQVSLEKFMGCGLGVCLSCVCPIKIDSGDWDYQRVCIEGPVFKSDEVVWDAV